ncbi:MAG: glycogen debranching N-terminal domain-containing protein [Cellvibrionaceae bacterium]
MQQGRSQPRLVAGRTRQVKIAQVAPLFESVPPKYYGGTERVVAYLCDGLVKLGHDVTLFASSDSNTEAKLVRCRDQAIRLDECPLKSELAAHLIMLDTLRSRAHEFDIIHFHIDLLPCPLFEEFAERTITTTHGRLDLKELKDFYRRWSHYPLVSISHNQRAPLEFANWLGTVHHGLPLDIYHPVGNPRGDYLAFLGRISPEKRPDVAIRAAQCLQQELRIAAKVDEANTDYFRDTIKPLLSCDRINFIGELADNQKSDFLGNAQALILPVGWPEPFGMVLIEAMACGTPVVACKRGAIPEIIEHGVTGFVVNDESEIVEALKQVKDLNRHKIRQEFERRFSASVMCDNYLNLYRQLLDRKPAVAGSSARDNSAMVIEPADETGSSSSLADSESRMPYKLFALKHRDTFAVADSFGNILGNGDGMFRDDTRVLSEFRLVVGDRPLALLSATISQDNVFFTTHVTNRPLPPLGGRSIPEGVIHLKRSRFLWDECLYERIQLVNYGSHDVSAPIKIHFGADFQDMFEVRGRKRPARGKLLAPGRGDHCVRLCYRGLDDVVRGSVIAFSEQPCQLRNDQAEFVLSLPCNTCVELYMEVGPDRNHSGAAAKPDRARFRQAAAHARRSMRRRGHGGGVLHSGERVFNSWLEHSRSDLALLTTELETGPYPYAGIPWFSTPFGRDAVITAMQMLWFDPTIARGVLAYLARNQAQETSSFRDSAPGKIMHETRKGEMNALKEIPFGLYYGGVDTTPLFVMLAGAYTERTGDLAFIDTIWPALEAAMAWIEQANATGDGFLDYASGEASGLRNQGWKDSEDSIFHADGNFPPSPIALVEVQGYKFAALLSMAALCKRRRDYETSGQWKKKAETMRDAVEKAFWMDDKCFYALALDANRNPCRVRSSNAGHLLFTGLPTAERAAKVTQQLLSSVFDCGWGIRTLATDETRYNPMSYHNGSVWPHDTAICAAGMARYGNRAAAAHILSELFDAAVHFGMRLPELFCGFQRFPGETPIAYPVACLPQAWASGSVFMTLQACLGLSVNGWKNEIQIHQPQLPHGINHLTVRKLPVGDTRVDLTFQRVRERVTVFTEQKGPEVRVLT